MKIENRTEIPPAAFIPKKLLITLETQEEWLVFKELMNHSVTIPGELFTSPSKIDLLTSMMSRLYNLLYQM